MVLPFQPIGQNNICNDSENELSITQGNPVTAKTLSIRQKALVIHLSTGTQENRYSARQYAEMLHPMFLDSNLAFPTIVHFVIETTNEDRFDAASVHINGVSYNPETKSLKAGVFPMHPYEIPKHIPSITEAYHRLQGASGISAVLKDSVRQE